MYYKVISYLNEKYWLKISTSVKFPWRHFWWNLEWFRGFLKYKKESIDIRNIPTDLKFKEEDYIYDTSYKRIEDF